MKKKQKIVTEVVKEGNTSEAKHDKINEN